jgi:hypothetical protein
MHYHNKEFDRSMVLGSMKSIKAGELGRQIAGALGEKGTYELVKQYEKDNHQHLVFRLFNDQLNYHDFELIKKGSQVKIADMFIYVTGENLSTTIATSLQYIDDREEAASKVGKKELKKVQLVKKYLNAQEYEKAGRIFETLPAVIKEQKLHQLIYVQIASGLSNDKYLAALNSFQQKYPEAPNMYLLMLDAYFLKKDYAAALTCVNRLDSLINKDLFLDYYRALIYKMSEDDVNRQACLERLHKNMPGFAAGTLQLIDAYVEDEQWDKAVSLTQQYRKGKDADTATLETLYLLYPEFGEKMETADQ